MSEVDNKLDQFNKKYEELYNIVREKYRDLRIKEFEDKDKVEFFIVNILPFMDDVASLNIDAFKYKYKGVHVLRRLRFSKLIKVDRKMIVIPIVWQTLNNLYQIGYDGNLFRDKIENYTTDEYYQSMLQNIDERMYEILVSNYKKCSNPDHISEDSGDSSSSEEEVEEEEEEYAKQSEDKNDKRKKNKENNKQEKIPDFIENSFIGKLAKEISEEVKPEDVGDPSKLFSSLFGALGQQTNNNSNTNQENNNKEQENSNRTGDNQGETNQENTQDQQNMNQGEDPAKALGNLGNLIGKVVQKIDNKMKSGNIDQSQLFKEAENMMGQMMGGGLGKMGGGLGGLGGALGGLAQMMGGMNLGGMGGVSSRKVKRKMAKMTKNK